MNKDQFGELFDSHYRRIYDFLYFRVQHKQTAEDLAAAVFLKAFQKFDQFDATQAKFSTWLYQIARHSLIDYFRTLKTSENIEDIWDIPSTSNVERDTDTALALEKVKDKIRLLPPLQRDILLMRLWDGLSHAQISAILGITEANSKVSFSRAVNKLKEDLSALIILFLLLNSL